MNVVTGACGHLGLNVVRALIAQGEPVRALQHSKPSPALPSSVEITHGDVDDFNTLLAAFRGAEVVYHLAGRITLRADDWENAHRVNVLGVQRVVRACLGVGVRRLVHVSSIHAVNPFPLDIPVDESRSPSLGSHFPVYDRSKALGELEIRKGVENGLDAVIIRPTSIVGPLDYRPSFIGQMLQWMAKGWLPALVPGGFDWVDARDVAAACIQAAKKAPADRIYMISGHWRSIRELAAEAARYSGIKPPQWITPLGLVYPFSPLVDLFLRHLISPLFSLRHALEVLQRAPQVTHQRATVELGYQPRPFEETIHDTLDWFYDRNKFL